VLLLGPDVRACVEMMSGAVWVRDRLQAAGWQVEVADARKVKGLAPLACKTDKVDARVLAELCRRDLVPAVWLPSLDDRALRERLKRRMHLVRMRTMARNRIHGVLTQWGLKLPVARVRQPDGLALLEARGVPEVWRRSVAQALAVIDWLDERLAPLERELRPLVRADPRVALLQTIPGVGPLLGLTMACEIGDIALFPSARKLVGYAGLAPKVKQSGQSARTGPLSPRRAPRRCGGPRWRPPSRPGGRTTRGTSCTARRRSARARATPARPPWPARSSSPPGTSCPASSPSSLAAATAAPILSRPAPTFIWPPDGPQRN
jgi:transposase